MLKYRKREKRNGIRMKMEYRASDGELSDEHETENEELFLNFIRVKYSLRLRPTFYKLLLSHIFLLMD